MGFNCLKHPCIRNYVSGGNLNDPIRDQAGGESIAPYVKIYFGDPVNPKITVGNQSNPSNPEWENASVIKSFNFGASTGMGCKVEIIDTQTGSFSYFIGQLSKCIQKSQDDFQMGAEWGWIVQQCNGSEQYSTPTLIKTDVIKFLINNIETIFGDGKIKYIITAMDTMDHVFASRNFECFGTNENPISLTQAIQQLCQQTDPKLDVEFFRYEKDQGFTSPIYWQAEVQRGEGPKAVFTSDGQNKLNTIRQWVEPFRTINDKGVICVWDTKSDTPKINILEDPTPNCNEIGGGDQSIIGRYIVNGGSCSPVISFTPQINWIAAISQLSSGGNSGGATTGESLEKTKECNVQGGSEEAGSAESIAISRWAEFVYGENALDETNKSQNAHIKAASSSFPMNAAITAELRIQGDPKTDYVHCTDYIGKYIALAVLNPFYLKGEPTSSYIGTNLYCGEWNAEPMCNEILSNKRWRIMGVDHSIKEGSYVTTLKLHLPTPGIDLPDNDKLGGSDSGSSYVIPNSC